MLRPRFRISPHQIALATLLAMALGGTMSCGPAETYNRVLAGIGGDGIGGNGAGGATGGAGAVGSGGMVGGTGGSGGPGSGGSNSGGSGTGGSGTGGRGSGGSSTGGASSGGSGSGGSSSGGSGSGGSSSGGSSSGGSSSGGSGTGGAAQRILSVDFVGGGGTGGTVPMASTEVAGYKPAARWNSATGAMGSLANMTLSDGSQTAAGITWMSKGGTDGLGFWRVTYADAPGDTRMMNGYLDPITAPGTITVSALPASITAGGYDVYVYFAGNVPSGMRTYGYAIGATTVTVSQAGPTPGTPNTFPGFTLAPNGGTGNCVVFRGVTGAGFTLTATPGTGTYSRAPVNGIQIVWPAGS